jgi:diamine N-acetyltransferase
MISNSIIRLRVVELEDLDILLEWENSPELMFFGDPHLPYSRHLMKRYVEAAEDDLFSAKQFRFIIEVKEKSQAIGHLDLYDFEPSSLKAAIGIVIAAEKERGKGYAKQALDLLEEYAFKTLFLHQLYAFVPDSNTISKALFESCGFKESARLIDWRKSLEGYQDVVLFQKLSGL